jgi:hypothetical protein
MASIAMMKFAGRGLQQQKEQCWPCCIECADAPQQEVLNSKVYIASCRLKRVGADASVEPAARLEAGVWSDFGVLSGFEVKPRRAMDSGIGGA